MKYDLSLHNDDGKEWVALKVQINANNGGQELADSLDMLVQRWAKVHDRPAEHLVAECWRWERRHDEDTG